MIQKPVRQDRQSLHGLCAALIGLALLTGGCGDTDSVKPAAKASNTDGNANDGGDGSDNTVSYLKFTNFQAASVVLGQADFAGKTANRGTGAAANTLNTPVGNPVVADGKLYIPDSTNNRILRFDSIPSQNGVNADAVVGQSGFTTTPFGTSASAMYQPYGLGFANGHFLVADILNYRVTIWNEASSVMPTAASLAMGQPDLSSYFSPSCTGTAFAPFDVVPLSNGKVIVADNNQSRILIWNSLPSSNSAAALVLGQPDMTTCTPNSEMDDPSGVWSDGTRLVAVDQSLASISIWNSFPTQNGQAPDLVVGPALSTGASLSMTSKVAVRGNQLFVADSLNNRILIWNTFPTASNTPPDVVLGQSDLSHTALNDDNQDGSADSNPTARTLYRPKGLLVHGTQLIVSDSFNNRVLIFDEAP